MLPRFGMAFSIVWLVLAGAGATHARPDTVETTHLAVRDATGSLSSSSHKSLADDTQALFERIVALWSLVGGVDQLGKIVVEFDLAGRGEYHSVLFWEGVGAERRQVVRVFGFARQPHQLAHKLTSAIFRQPDKLIRNMMGVVTEARLGNPLAFPRCGFHADAWVSAFAEMGASRPLDELGSDHESWGMRLSGRGEVTVFDRAKQHLAYAEAGSFGIYLFETYGADTIKRLHRLSHARPRPFQEVFGRSLRELEADWRAKLREAGSQPAGEIATLAALIRRDPATACAVAAGISASQRR